MMHGETKINFGCGLVFQFLNPGQWIRFQCGPRCNVRIFIASLVVGLGAPYEDRCIYYHCILTSQPINVRVNVTWRRVSVTIVAVEKQ